MKITHLKLANIRAIKAAEFRFRPGFNLIIGVNGAGKTTVLDALSVCLSYVIRHANKLPKSYGTRFHPDDIRKDANILDVLCGVEDNAPGARCDYAFRVTCERAARQAKNVGKPHEQATNTPEKAEFIGEAPPVATGTAPGGRPLAVLFSSHRAISSKRAPSSAAAAGSVTAAFRNTLSRRDLRIGELEKWIRTQDASSERTAGRSMLGIMEGAIARFLPDFRNLRLSENVASGNPLLIDRDTATLAVRLLSNGERGVLAMVLDLTLRLAHANPEMKNPAAEAEAIVLIDDIELHLHPVWQRRIVTNLTRTFPKCQFVATTHSPQVIGEVEHDRIQVIDDNHVYSPSHSFGVDSSRVLEEIMGAERRTGSVDDLLSRISRTVGDKRYGEARNLLDDLSNQLGENDPEVTHVRTLLDFMTADE